MPRSTLPAALVVGILCLAIASTASAKPVLHVAPATTSPAVVTGEGPSAVDRAVTPAVVTGEGPTVVDRGTAPTTSVSLAPAGSTGSDGLSTFAIALIAAGGALAAGGLGAAAGRHSRAGVPST